MKELRWNARTAALVGVTLPVSPSSSSASSSSSPRAPETHSSPPSPRGDIVSLPVASLLSSEKWGFFGRRIVETITGGLRLCVKTKRRTLCRPHHHPQKSEKEEEEEEDGELVTQCVPCGLGVLAFVGWSLPVLVLAVGLVFHRVIPDSLTRSFLTLFVFGGFLCAWTFLLVIVSLCTWSWHRKRGRGRDGDADRHRVMPASLVLESGPERVKPQALHKRKTNVRDIECGAECEDELEDTVFQDEEVFSHLSCCDARFLREHVFPSFFLRDGIWMRVVPLVVGAVFLSAFADLHRIQSWNTLVSIEYAWILSMWSSLVVGFAVSPIFMRSAPELFSSLQGSQNDMIVSWSRIVHTIPFLLLHLISSLEVSWIVAGHVARVSMCFLPLFWSMGWLSQIDVFLIWMVETLNVVVCGTTMMSSDSRTVYLFLWNLFSCSAVAASWILHGSLLSLCVSIILAYVTASQIVNFASFCRRLLHAVLCIFLISGTILLVLLTSQSDTSTLNSNRSNTVLQLIRIIVLSLSALVLLFDVIQNELVFGLFRNCCFQCGSPSKTLSFLNRYIIRILFVLSCYVYLFFTSSLDTSSIQIDWSSISHSILLFRACSLSVLHVQHSSVVFGLIAVFDLASLRTSIFGSWSLVLIIAVVSWLLLFVSRAASSLSLWIRIYFSSLGSYRYRHRGFSTIFCTQIILFPLFLVLIAIGALLGAPLYLFLGSFMIFPSSPTRQRFWKDWDGVQIDESHPAALQYRALMSTFSANFQDMYLQRSANHSMEPEYFIARSDPFTLWIEVLPHGSWSAQILYKGLELQTTSCHALEATFLDEICNAESNAAVIDGSRDHSPCCACSHSFTFVSTFNAQGMLETKTSLAGVVTPDILTYLECGFCWALLYEMHVSRDLLEFTLIEPGDVRSALSTILSSRRFLEYPVHWIVRNGLLSSEFASDGGVSLNLPSSDEFARRLIQGAQCLMDALFSPTFASITSRISDSTIHNRDPSIVFLEFFQGMTISRSLSSRHPSPDVIYRLERVCRIACKYALDYFFAGEEIDEQDESSSSTWEYVSSLQSWYFGSFDGPRYTQSLQSGCVHFFDLFFTSDRVLHSRWMKPDHLSFSVFSLRKDVVHAIWRGMEMELLYAANDDDERFSIQAHEPLLRNLTVQSAHPPLGYPIFASSSCISSL